MTGAWQPENRLLAALPPETRERIGPSFRAVDLELGELLWDAGQPITRAYFPTSGVVSIVAEFETGYAAEMSTIGREGMVPVETVLGSDTVLARHLVQVPGTALTINIQDLRGLEQELVSFRKLLFVYTQAFLGQVLHCVACNSLHSIEQRAARWLLMCHDRSYGNTCRITQGFLAEMLGASRPTVNVVATTLQRAGFISYNRGVITIKDRAGLERAACECYGLIRRQYEQRVSVDT